MNPKDLFIPAVLVAGIFFALGIIVGHFVSTSDHASSKPALVAPAAAAARTVTIVFKPTNGTATITEPYRTALPGCPAKPPCIKTH